MRKIAVLYDAGQAVLSTFDLDEVLQRILAIARDYFHLQNVAILLLDKEAAAVVCPLADRLGRRQRRDPPGHGTRASPGPSVLKKQPVYAPDVSKDPRYICAAQSTRSELAIPLMVRDEVVGVLDCQSDRLNHFDHETIDLLTLFSTQASIALQNARLYSLERQRARSCKRSTPSPSKAPLSSTWKNCWTRLFGDSGGLSGVARFAFSARRRRPGFARSSRNAHALHPRRAAAFRPARSPGRDVIHQRHPHRKGLERRPGVAQAFQGICLAHEHPAHLIRADAGCARARTVPS